MRSSRPFEIHAVISATVRASHLECALFAKDMVGTKRHCSLSATDNIFTTTTTSAFRPQEHHEALERVCDYGRIGIASRRNKNNGRLAPDVLWL